MDAADTESGSQAGSCLPYFTSYLGRQSSAFLPVMKELLRLHVSRRLFASLLANHVRHNCWTLMQAQPVLKTM